MMKSGLRVAFLLLMVTGTWTVKGSDLPDGLNGNAALRPKREFSVYDFLRGKGGSSVRPNPAKPTGGDAFGFNLADALRPGDPTPKPAGGLQDGFNLEDALRPAPKPTGGECAGNMVEKLSKVIENQNEQLKLLQRLAARQF